MSIKPYYQTELGKLYHGDCNEIMPLINPSDIVIADPLYPKMKGGLIHLDPHITRSKTIGSDCNVNLDWIPIAWESTKKGMLIFCSYHFVADIPKLIPSPPVNLLTWHKRNAPNPICNRPKYTTEFIWLFQKSPGLTWRNLETSMFDIPNLTAGCGSTGERILKCNNGPAAHPMQKPLLLYLQLLIIGGKSVLDPFFGTGTTAIACERMNRRWIGIEIKEEYCEMAVKRVEHEKQQLQLFKPKTERQPKQQKIF